MKPEEQGKEYILITVARCDVPVSGIATQLLSSFSDAEMQKIAQRMTHGSSTQHFWEDFLLNVSITFLERKMR